MNKIKIELKWAFIFTGMMLVWMLLERLAGLHDVHIDKHAIFTNFVAIPAITIYVFALLDKRKSFHSGTMTYGQGFMAGMVMTAFITLLSPLTQYITSEIISPDYFTNIINYAVSNDTMSRPDAEKYFNLQAYMIQVLIFTPFMGIVTTAIVAIFTRRKSN